jgi:Protein of unknown function (DUF1553)
VTSTTPLQSLYFINDPVVHDQANRFAKTIITSFGDDQRRLSFAYCRALGREPNADELAGALVFLEKSRAASGVQADEATERAWQAMVRVIFRLNEFIYVD